ncbi:MAG: response regulator transcription factor [Tannerellaceae bacterium]|jgi:DNA-binding response OmpR family regulator|nr:response regulator transcription factor [Tannerellaceae bacterium]
MRDNKKKKVLLVEDETTLSMIIRDTLEDEGFELTHAPDGLKGYDCFLSQKPDIVIADVMMPGMDGFEMVKKIRTVDKATPVLFLTARSTLDDLVHGFNLGANDYLKKPFKMLELVMRIKALTNRIVPANTGGEVFRIGEYQLNTTTQTLIHEKQSQELSYMENEILKHLCINQNQVVEIKDILYNLWNDDSCYNRNSLHVFIYKLRKRLSMDSRVKILNIRSIGYKLIVQ